MKAKIRGNFLFYTVLILMSGFFLLPSAWLIISSLKKEIEFMAYPIKFFPAIPQWINYYLAVTVAPFWRYLWNTVVLATVYTVLTVITSSMVGYGFARLDAPGKKFLFMIVIAMIMLPFTIILIPQFIVFSRLHLVNTYWPWILWGLGGNAFHIFLFRQFFSTIPSELEDAAEVDGCNQFDIYWRIFLPNSLPVIATSAIFNFTGVWGDWLGPTLYLSGKISTLAAALTGQFYVNPHSVVIVTLTLAAVVLYMLPMIVIFLFGQKYIVQGVVTTGLKG